MASKVIMRHSKFFKRADVKITIVVRFNFRMEQDQTKFHAITRPIFSISVYHYSINCEQQVHLGNFNNRCGVS